MARIVEHRKLPDGTYRLIVEIEPPDEKAAAECDRRLQEGEPIDADLAEQADGRYRAFPWGSIPRVPVGGADESTEAYAPVHGRKLKTGGPVVTEDEYALLQVAEACETVRLEEKQRRSRARGKQLPGEGVEFK